MKQIEISIGNMETGEVYLHPDMGIVEKLDMRRRQHREGWVTEASFPSCYASAVRWITENVNVHGYQGYETPVHGWSVKITIGLDSITVGPEITNFTSPTKIVDCTTVGGDSVRYIVKGTDNLAKRYEAWDFEYESDPELHNLDENVRYVLEIDETLEVGTDPVSDDNFDSPDDVIWSIDSVTFPKREWTERPTYRYRKQ